MWIVYGQLVTWSKKKYSYFLGYTKQMLKLQMSMDLEIFKIAVLENIN